MAAPSTTSTPQRARRPLRSPRICSLQLRNKLIALEFLYRVTIHAAPTTSPWELQRRQCFPFRRVGLKRAPHASKIRSTVGTGADTHPRTTTSGKACLAGGLRQDQRRRSTLYVLPVAGSRAVFSTRYRRSGGERSRQKTVAPLSSRSRKRRRTLRSLRLQRESRGHLCDAAPRLGC